MIAQIERGVPIPPVVSPAVRLGIGYQQIGEAMKVGDSRLMTYAEAKNLRTTMYHVCPGSSWAVRQEGDLFRIWRRA